MGPTPQGPVRRLFENDAREVVRLVVVMMVLVAVVWGRAQQTDPRQQPVKRRMASATAVPFPPRVSSLVPRDRGGVLCGVSCRVVGGRGGVLSWRWCQAALQHDLYRSLCFRYRSSVSSCRAPGRDVAKILKLSYSLFLTGNEFRRIPVRAPRLSGR